jgi:hypothetical protein
MSGHAHQAMSEGFMNKTKDQTCGSPSVLRSSLPINDGLIHREHLAKTSILWERLSTSRFPYRHTRLYALLLELRSSYHRILLVWKRGDIREIQTGLVWEKISPECLTLNRRTLGRKTDMQLLLSSLPWLSPEDWHLFLLGWDGGWECRANTSMELNSGNGLHQSPSPRIIPQQSD